jgi:hypothetical protein
MEEERKMTGMIVKLAGVAALAAGLAFGSTASRAADFAAPIDGIVASDTDAGALVQKAWFGCGPYRCGWHPNRYFARRFGFWRPRPVVRCGPYHCWRRVSEAAPSLAA